MQILTWNDKEVNALRKRVRTERTTRFHSPKNKEPQVTVIRSQEDCLSDSLSKGHTEEVLEPFVLGDMDKIHWTLPGLG